MDPLVVYRELADQYESLNQMAMRDRFLILAADAALQSGQPADAERFRQRLLQTSRYHMLRPYGSFAEATQAPDVQTYLRDLRANYPVEVALQLLESLRGGEQRPVEQTQPFPFLHGSQSQSQSQTQQPLPPTAPVVDVYGQRGSRPAWQGRSSTPTAMPPAETPIDSTPAPAPYRPQPQSRIPATRALPSTPPPSNPPPARAPAPAPPMGSWRNDPQPTASPASSPSEPAAGGWFGSFLGVLVAIAALALAAFTFARPFLPANLLH